MPVSRFLLTEITFVVYLRIDEVRLPEKSLVQALKIFVDFQFFKGEGLTVNRFLGGKAFTIAEP